ncbi:MAG: energy transducer TonB [Bacteroidota bacterium]|nr:energy transducer TonB [Bacteroidota bacterium]
MRLFKVFIILIVFSISAKAQTDSVSVIQLTPSEEQTFLVTEQMPEYPGGNLAMRKDIAENITYPKKAYQSAIHGTVYIRFVVNKTGHIERAEVIRGVYKSLDDEALRVVNNLKKFKPGTVGGKPVSVWFTIPIKFKIDNKKKSDK